MIVTVYTRHFPKCPKHNDRTWRRCRCPKWLYCSEWTPDRKSAKTRSWERAETLARKLEAGEDTLHPKTISDAVLEFIADKEQQSVSEAWLNKFRLLLKKELLPWVRVNGYEMLSELTLETLGNFRKTWTGKPITRRKKQERLRSWLHFCVRHGWIRDNPAKYLSPIRSDSPPTMPLDQEEFQALLEAVEKYGAGSLSSPETVTLWRTRLRALLLLMRWSGLRIGDAATLKPARIRDGKLFLYTSKTGTPVWMPLPKSVLTALDKLPKGEHYFWSGRGTVKSATSVYQRAFKRLAELAGLTCHPHQLRDTCAVEMLLAGVPMEQVSILLGHSSIRITERHYAPWSKARQEQLETSVRKAWVD